MKRRTERNERTTMESEPKSQLLGVFPTVNHVGTAYGTKVCVIEMDSRDVDGGRPPSAFSENGELGRRLASGKWGAEECIVTPDVLEVLDAWVVWTWRVCPPEDDNE